jgi:hypothetical protein
LLGDANPMRRPHKQRRIPKGATTPRSKEWIVTEPSGKTHVVISLKHWCEQHELPYKQIFKLTKLPNGFMKGHLRGWKVQHSPCVV